MPIRLPLLLRMQRLIKQLRTRQAEIELELSLLDCDEDDSDNTPTKNVTISHASITKIEDDETSIKEAHNDTAGDEQSISAKIASMRARLERSKVDFPKGL